MALIQRLDLRQSQALVMTPQLQQAIKLLQLSNLELSAYVESELEQNPLLERDESDPASPADTPTAAPPAADLDGVAAPVNGLERDSVDLVSTEALPGANEQPLDYDGSAGPDVTDDPADFSGDSSLRTGSGRTDFDDGEIGIEQTLTRPETLREHLEAQLVDVADARDRLIGLHLIDLVDDAGYLTADLRPVADQLGCPVERVEAVLKRLQAFDPPGVMARSLAECLALQLKEKNRLDPAMEALLAHLPLLARRDAPQLCRLCGVDEADLSEMVAEIRALNPKPGEAFATEPPQPITPDILMRAQPGGAWLIELNADTLPRVLVNTRYYTMVNRHTLKREERDYLSERLASANWLVKSLHQRATTILKVASEIVRQQDAFFLHGVTHLRPLILRDIAEAIGMHESTVSRVTTNKYLATSRGIFELKYFFTSAIPGASGQAAHSAEAVRFRIKALIDQETADDILSDDRIVEMLLADGIDIARRTVAKYREAQRIPSSVQRRREKSLTI